MKSIKYTAILIILIFVALYFFNSDSTAVEQQTREPNLVSLQTQASPTQAETKTIQKPRVNGIDKATNLSVQEVVNITAKQTEPAADLDYVNAYRDWQYFANCYTDINDFKEDKDPLQTLAERFAENPRENQSEPTPQQNIYYQQHVDICSTLIQEVSEEPVENDYYLIMGKLQTRFEATIPKTAEAKQLAHALEMVKQVRIFKDDYYKAFSPVSNLSEQATALITQKIENLSNQLMQIYDDSDELTPQQTAMIEQLSNEIESLNIELSENSSINQQALTQYAQQLDGYFNSIDDYIHKIQSPDAFLLLANILYSGDNFFNQTTALQRMKQQTGINDSQYIQILNKLVLPLVACSMNYPCDAQSDIMMNYCLGLRTVCLSKPAVLI